METVSKSVKFPWLFMGCSIIFLIGLGIALLTTDKAAFHLWLNSLHTQGLDFVMKHYTNLGEWMAYIIAALFIVNKLGWCGYIMSNLILSGIIVQPLKYAFSTLRPITYFAIHHPEVQLPLVEGVRMSEYYSMPSGHTTTFFVLGFSIALVIINEVKNRRLAIGLEVVLFLLTILGAYSRIYLSQHFAEDIWAGACIGLIVPLMTLIGLKKWYNVPCFQWNLGKIRKK